MIRTFLLGNNGATVIAGPLPTTTCSPRQLRRSSRRRRRRSCGAKRRPILGHVWHRGVDCRLRRRGLGNPRLNDAVYGTRPRHSQRILPLNTKNTTQHLRLTFFSVYFLYAFCYLCIPFLFEIVPCFLLFIASPLFSLCARPCGISGH